MKLSQTLLPALASLSLALTPACTQKSAEKPALTEQDRELCDLAIRHTRYSIGAIYILKVQYPDKMEYPISSDYTAHAGEGIDLYTKTQLVEQNLISSREMLMRDCDARFDDEKPALRTCEDEGGNAWCKLDLSQLRNKVKALTSGNAVEHDFFLSKEDK
ncbi:MAG: hypothetical protein NTX63_04195 [Candidatus Peregrinibacteria bacterium]|nr:hypothetical protein [Candidatus Peregrinibacteria bacterium]